jgi:hypothetical protein
MFSFSLMNAEGILHLLGEEYTPNAEGFLLFTVFFRSRFGILTNSSRYFVTHAGAISP